MTFEEFQYGELGQRYKLRAESIFDFIDLLICYPGRIWRMKMEQETNQGDTVVEFSTFLTLKEILQYFQTCDDTEIMMDTISPIDKYTGLRRFIDWDNVDEIDDDFMSTFILEVTE